MSTLPLRSFSRSSKENLQLVGVSPNKDQDEERPDISVLISTVGRILAKAANSEMMDPFQRDNEKKKLLDKGILRVILQDSIRADGNE